MADTKTAAEWTQVAEQVKAQIEANSLLYEKLIQQQNQVQQQVNQLIAQRNSIVDPVAKTQFQNTQIKPLIDQANSLKFNANELAGDNIFLKVEYENALRQAEIASESPQGTRANPTTLSNTPPVNAEPGNNTDVPPANTDAFLLANAEPETINEAVNGLDLPEQDTEFGNLDAAIEQQKQIAINTSGLPVLAEDGSVAQGVAINPETGETYYTGAGPGTNPLVTNNENPSVTTGTVQARSGGNAAQETPFPEAPDWRVRISLAPTANYLYTIATEKDILYPLKATNGVIFPYVPQINVTYNANYDATDLTHSNFKIYNYRNSSVDNINISGEFTAQDTTEANYLLAVIHFFRCVTKMFYGKDQNPIRGVPPPLVYLSGHGEYGFDNHPMVVNNFSLNYPTDVDYINAGFNLNPFMNTTYTYPTIGSSPSANRLAGSKLNPGGTVAQVNFSQSNSTSSVTRVPTKLQIQITAYPVVSRYDISNNFSLKEYATGKLLQGSKRPTGGGIW